MQELIQLPFDIQAVLVAGYLGYALYKRDHRKGEKHTDMLVLMLVYGLPTAIVIQLWHSPWAYLSVLIAPLLATLWVKLFSERWQKLLYKTDISHNINEGDVWKTLGTAKGVFATQIILYHRNGKRYMCANTNDFNGKDHAPFAPYIIDDDGIAFYVTDTQDEQDSDWQAVDLTCQFTGSLLTYFPRADIELLDMRYIQPKTNH